MNDDENYYLQFQDTLEMVEAFTPGFFVHLEKTLRLLGKKPSGSVGRRKSAQKKPGLHLVAVMARKFISARFFYMAESRVLLLRAICHLPSYTHARRL